MKPHDFEHDRSEDRNLPAVGCGPASIWWIGKGLVTTAEIESWQLGPDLTEAVPEEETFDVV